MGLPEKKWWKKTFAKSEPKSKVETLKDIESIHDFLDEIDNDSKSIQKILDQLEELEKERLIARESIVHVNLESQAKIMDKLIERYEFFQNDADINGLRVKRIATEFLKHAEKAGMKDLVKMKKQDMRWRFPW